jgi:hypothetical protein
MNILKNKYLKIAGFSFFSLSTLILAGSMIYSISLGKSVSGKLDKDPNSDVVAESIQVSILNACGVDGLASKARTYLRKRGFDVVEVGNYYREMDRSIIIDRIDDLRSAYKSAYAIGISDSMVYSNPDSSLYLRSTIIIGKDYQNLKFWE